MLVFGKNIHIGNSAGYISSWRPYTLFHIFPHQEISEGHELMIPRKHTNNVSIFEWVSCFYNGLQCFTLISNSNIVETRISNKDKSNYTVAELILCGSCLTLIYFSDGNPTVCTWPRGVCHFDIRPDLQNSIQYKYKLVSKKLIQCYL